MPLVSQQHKEEYRESGYCLVPGLIPRDRIEAARQRITEVAADPEVWPATHFQLFDPGRYTSRAGKPLPGGVQRPASRDSVFADIAEHPRLVEAMGALLGGEVEPFTDQIGLKHGVISEQQGACSYFHQDSFYWKIDPERGCNCWIPLTDVGPEASALAVMPGSQSGWQLIDHESYYDDPPLGRMGASGFEPFKRHRVPQQQVDPSREVLVAIEPGDGLFFTNYTWHRSEPNRSGETQAFYAIAYQLKEVGSAS